MPTPSPHPELQIHSSALTTGGSGRADNARTYGLLDHFFQELSECRRLGPQTNLALNTMRESLGADLVYRHCADAEEDTQRATTENVSVLWCAEFLAKLLAEAPADKGLLLWSGRHPGPQDDTPIGLSAALVRVAVTPATWLVAVNFDRERRFHEADLKLISLAWKMAQQNRLQVQTQQRLKESLVGMLKCLSTALDARDSCTAGHSERVARIAVLIGKQMKVQARIVSDLYLAGLLHDIGKIGIPDAVLMKPGKLTAEEAREMQEHAVIGDRIVAEIKPFAHLRVGVRHHHEHYDGTGYPDGLRGEGIPLLARILAVADSCDAMMSTRRYRSALTPPQIDTIFRKQSGIQWDPVVLEAFGGCKQEIYPPIYQQGIGDSAFHAIDNVMQHDFGVDTHD